MRYEYGSTHAAFAEWCRCRLYLLDEIFTWKDESIYKLHLPPIFKETEGEEFCRVLMIIAFVFDLVDQGHRMIVLCPGPDMPGLGGEQS